MDKEISAQFKEKNLEILKNKLQLDVNNNMNTLTLSLSCILELEMGTALPKFLTIYSDSDAVPQEKEQYKILKKISSKFLEETKKYLKTKKSDFIRTIQASSMDSLLDIYHQTISSSEQEFSDNLKDTLKLYIENSLSEEIQVLNRKVVNLSKQEFVYERTMVFLIDNLSRRLIDKTVEQLKVRNQTLLNNAKAAYDHYYMLVDFTSCK